MRRSVEAWQAECAVPPVVRRGHQNADTWLGPYERAAPLFEHGQAFGLAVFAWRHDSASAAALSQLTINATITALGGSQAERRDDNVDTCDPSLWTVHTCTDARV